MTTKGICMKYIIAIILSFWVIGASANPNYDCRHGGCNGYHNPHHNYHNHHNHHNRHRNHDWVAPVLGGLIIGAMINEANKPRVIERPVTPIIVDNQPFQNICSEWREVWLPDGRIVRERTCYQR